MQPKHNKQLVLLAKQLRKEMTKEERHLRYDDNNTGKDAARTAFLEGYGLTVIRIPSNEVSSNFCGVCEYIDVAVRQSLSQLR